MHQQPHHRNQLVHPGCSRQACAAGSTCLRRPACAAPPPTRASPLPVAGAAQRPAFGLSASGRLHWGDQQLAADVTSVVLRHGGDGGPALLYITRQQLLYTALLQQLGSYSHQAVVAQERRVLASQWVAPPRALPARACAEAAAPRNRARWQAAASLLVRCHLPPP
jgi:hypothetical protein